MKTTYHFIVTCSNSVTLKSKEYDSLKDARAAIAKAFTYAKKQGLAVFDIRTRKIETNDDGSTMTTGWI